jgi:hypothetical protein
MIEKFAGTRCKVWSEFLDLNHTSKSMLLVSRLAKRRLLAVLKMESFGVQMVDIYHHRVCEAS